MFSFLRPDVDRIISGFVKAQAKLQTFIDRESEELASDTATISLLQGRAIERNQRINRAYRVIHNLDQLVA